MWNYIMPATNGTKEISFTYAGFKLGCYLCFYCDDVMLYFTQTSIDTMLKNNKIYKECVKSLEKAKNIISGDLYEFSNELQEVINN